MSEQSATSRNRADPIDVSVKRKTLGNFTNKVTLSVEILQMRVMYCTLYTLNKEALQDLISDNRDAAVLQYSTMCCFRNSINMLYCTEGVKGN